MELIKADGTFKTPGELYDDYAAEIVNYIQNRMTDKDDLLNLVNVYRDYAQLPGMLFGNDTESNYSIIEAFEDLDTLDVLKLGAYWNERSPYFLFDDTGAQRTLQMTSDPWIGIPDLKEVAKVILSENLPLEDNYLDGIPYQASDDLTELNKLIAEENTRKKILAEQPINLTAGELTDKLNKLSAGEFTVNELVTMLRKAVSSPESQKASGKSTTSRKTSGSKSTSSKTSSSNKTTARSGKSTKK